MTDADATAGLNTSVVLQRRKLRHHQPVAINDWWAGNGAERYWMEITDRDGLGADLRAPQSNPDGRDVWHYTLVRYTEPGDIVFHWHRTWAGEPAIVGWSEIVGPLVSDSMEWLAHGTVGRARGRAATLPNWVMPLGGFHEFDRPVTRRMLNSEIQAVVKRMDDLPYAPFYRYRDDELRAMQAYLTKFPAALVPLVESLAKSRVPPPPDNRKKGAARRGVGGQGRLSDPVLRKEIENYAVDAAIRHYEAAGASDIEILGKPYDLKVMIGGQERHVEVKGTTVDGAVSVVLTVNEVAHARDWPRTDLFVLDGIDYEVKKNGKYRLTGGFTRLWTEWAPSEEHLHPTEFAYDLPAGHVPAEGL